MTKLFLFLILIFPLNLWAEPVNNIDTKHAVSSTILIDVRTVGEFNAGHLPDAINIDYQVIRENIENYYPDKSSPIKVYCRSGNRSGIAKATLELMGYTNVENIGGYEMLRHLPEYQKK